MNAPPVEPHKMQEYIDDRAAQLAETLRIELARRNITATDLSKTTGVSMSQISFIRNGKTNPKFETICRIEYALRCKLV